MYTHTHPYTHTHAHTYTPRKDRVKQHSQADRSNTEDRQSACTLPLGTYPVHVQCDHVIDKGDDRTGDEDKHNCKLLDSQKDDEENLRGHTHTHTRT